MAQTPVRILSPEEREYARYLSEVEVRTRRAADLHAERDALEDALGRFAAEYHVRVGSLFVALDRVRLATEEYERRLAHLRADPAANPRRIEEDILHTFAGRHEEVRRDEEDARRYEQAFARDRTRPRLDDTDEAESARLYRELARRFHPDLARSDVERRRREPLMRRANAAFHARNLAELRALVQEAAANDPAFEMRSLGERLIWAIREVARLDALIADLEAALAGIRMTADYALWQRVAADERVMQRLEDDLRRELDAAQDRLTTLLATYRQRLEPSA